MNRILYLSIAALPVWAYAAIPAYSDLNLPKAGSGETFFLTFLIAALFGSVALFEMVRMRRELYVEKNVIEKRFAENVKRFSLDGEERRLLRAIAAQGRVADSNELFTSLPVFEQGIDRIVMEFLGSQRDEAEGMAFEDLLQSLRKKMHYGILDAGQPIISTRNLSPGQTVWMLGPKKTVLGEASVALVRELYFTIKLREAAGIRVARTHGFHAQGRRHLRHRSAARIV
jgi:hypothetical protein